MRHAICDECDVPIWFVDGVRIPLVYNAVLFIVDLADAEQIKRWEDNSYVRSL